MAPSYSSNGGYGYSSSSFQPKHRRSDSTSFLDDLRAFLAHSSRSAWRFWRERGRFIAWAALINAGRRLRMNLTYNRLFSFPHLLVAAWIVVLLWGERWVFHSAVEECEWEKWERWPAGANPHRLVLVADPQLIDPHSYPGRPWPLNPLTMTIVDNYIRRSYTQMQSQLDPDTIFFLGDLFDGGREWKTAHGDFRDPEWGPHPKDEQKYLKSWNKKYNEFYWLKEYARFGEIFFTPWLEAGQKPENEHKRRKLIASLPGNHDLGFGAEIKLPVRNRFEAYFGEGNRVDVVGNHTFVSVDTVSMSAASLSEIARQDVQPIYKPTEHFLNQVKWTKQKAVEKELRYLRGEVPEVKLHHRIEELNQANFKDQPRLINDENSQKVPDLPTILLTHVPLYRPPGTPCGPKREHWPPTPPPKGQTEPVFPDHRNAISVYRGYQYQNVLDEKQSISLIEKTGNVIHAFSGDDHDYCEVVHAPNQGSVREITVKSISMAMGVPTPGFQMVSLYNPLDPVTGKPLAGDGQPTMQTHLCLLPNQISTYLHYVGLGIFCVILLTIRAFLVPVLNLPRFSLDSDTDSHPSGISILPVFKAKQEDYDEYSLPSAGYSASSKYYGSSGTSGERRTRTASVSSSSLKSNNFRNGHNEKSGSSSGRSRKSSVYSNSNKSVKGWSWGGKHGHHHYHEPRIEIPGENEEDLYYGGAFTSSSSSKWRARQSRKNQKPKTAMGVVVTELWTTVWRVAWMVVVVFGWLAWKG
ncbi:calcineurin-like phosphoesterase-domain-containing protein [Neurospora hispaniola]|uniref:Calcineurin-like phosphoesterase-domain-containing protein n=1 Tax=Neurospora hispaniola TaxID=588809 RepID=A0AAJ0MPV7_9PEZI|nr:calcineurin-like phosphoesterase-domain-containing protein [Neurospora hispaniola]